MKRIIAAAIGILAACPAFAFTETVPPSMSQMTWSTVTCGTTTTPLPAASTFMLIKIPQAGATVFFGFSGNPATTSTPSVDFPGGTWVTFGGGQSQCIVASGTQPISVGVK